MSMLPVEVNTYDGYRGGERPESFVLKGERVNVTSVLRAWTEEAEGHRLRCFSIRGSDGFRYVLCQEESEDRWFLRSP